MTYKEAKETYFNYKKEDLGPYKKLLGIRCVNTDIIITEDQFVDDCPGEYGVVVENSNPEFVNMINSLISDCKQTNKKYDA